MAIKIKVLQRPTVKMKVLPRFPSRIVGSSGIGVTFSNTIATFALDYPALTNTPSIGDDAFVAFYDSVLGYGRITLTDLLTGRIITTPTLTVLDNAFTLQDNGDPTKQLQFQVSGITTGTTRTLTAPDANTTIAGLSVANVFTAEQTVTINQDNATGFTASNNSTGTGARSRFSASNGTYATTFGMGGVNYTGVAVLQNRGYINAASSSSGIVLNNNGANPTIFATSASEVARVLNGFMVGTTTDPGAGIVNVLTGYRIGNAATSGNVLRGNGTNFVSAQLGFSDLSGTIATGQVSGSYTGITGVGTLTVGTWNATTIDATHGGTAQTSWTLGDLLYASGSNALSKLSGNTTATKKFLRQTGNGSVSANPAWDTIVAADVPGSALTKTDDTNVTLTLGGSASTALLNAASLTLGWAGTLAVSRGGTGGGSASGTLLDNITGFASTGMLARTASGTYAFRTIAGTSNRISLTNGDGVAGAPTIDISASYVGQSSITTLGTIGTGVWQGTKVGLLYGGTNADLSATGGTSQVLKQVSAGAAVTVGQLAFTDISGTASNSQLANAAAYTFKGNATGSSAAPTDFTIAGLTHKSSPASTDLLILSDEAASHATKYCTISEAISAVSAGVTTFNGRSGSVSPAGNDYPAIFVNYLSGLTLAYVTTTTFSVAVGAANDSTNACTMVLGSSLTKSTSSWAVGNNNGGIDTGSIASSTWYHVYLIRRSDTGVVDVLFSTSASSPTMPTNYDQKRRIGSIKTDGSSHFVQWVQDGDTFQWNTPVQDVNATNPGTSAVTRTLSVPTGVRVEAIYSVSQLSTSTSSNPAAILISDLSISDVAPAVDKFMTTEAYGSVGSHPTQSGGWGRTFTNTSAQVRSRVTLSDANISIYINTAGWVDRRGRDG